MTFIVASPLSFYFCHPPFSPCLYRNAVSAHAALRAFNVPQRGGHIGNKTASFQKEAMRTQVALYFFYEVKFV